MPVCTPVLCHSFNIRSCKLLCQTRCRFYPGNGTELVSRYRHDLFVIHEVCTCSTVSTVYIPDTSLVCPSEIIVNLIAVCIIKCRMQPEPCPCFLRHIVICFSQMITYPGINRVIYYRADQIVELRLIHHDLPHAAIFCIILITIPSYNSTIICNVAFSSAAVHRKGVKVCPGCQIDRSGYSGKSLVFIVHLHTKNIITKIT